MFPLCLSLQSWQYSRFIWIYHVTVAISLTLTMLPNMVHSIKQARGIIVLCLVIVYHNLQGIPMICLIIFFSFRILLLPWCQWSSPEAYRLYMHEMQRHIAPAMRLSCPVLKIRGLYHHGAFPYNQNDDIVNFHQCVCCKSHIAMLIIWRASHMALLQYWYKSDISHGQAFCHYSMITHRRSLAGPVPV